MRFLKELNKIQQILSATLCNDKKKPLKTNKRKKKKKIGNRTKQK